MKVVRIVFFFFAIAVIAAPVWWYISADVNEKEFDDDEPDLPTSVKITDKEEYFRLRNEHLDLLRGYDTAEQDSRTNAVRKMEQAERELAAQRAIEGVPTLVRAWRPLGPAPIPVPPSATNSGRVSAIAVHPTNPNIVYVGTAQGGLYRTLDGGATWTPLMDSALTLAIGAVAIAPSDPTTVFVGTGEAALCGSGCFIGVGLYRITNADTAPLLSQVINKDAGGNDVFTGRAVGEIIIHPTDPNIVFAGTTTGVAGLGQGTTGATLPNAGLFRTTNAMSADPRFAKIAISGTLGLSRSVVDLAIEPGNPNRMVAAVIGSGNDGGVYLSTDALATTPTFTRTLATGDGSTLGRTEFAVNKTGDVVTIFAATGTSNGTLFKSVDAGATFNPAGGGTGFCSSQCFYDIAVEVDPTDVNRVYLGGSPSLVFGRSTTGGAAFTNSSNGLHVDTQAFALAPSNPSIMYFGSDGGIWKTGDVRSVGAVTWTSLNNTTFSATQFMGLALHPVDRNYLLGGTQDNGTEFLAPDGFTWVRSDGGDGGFAAIDQNATTPTNVVAYHTYFSQTTTQVGFERALATEPSGDPFWSTFQGCRNGTSNNGILCADPVLFYAPLVRGPGTPNTIYYGTNRLYRSMNMGTTMTDVSGTLPARLGAIAIAPQDDNVRLVGLTTGAVYLSMTAGATTMTNVTGPIPARYIGRIAIDPTNANVAYVALNGFGLPAGQHVWKTTNLLTGAPTWAPAGAGIPDTPANAFAIDPANTQNIFAGTDIGVFRSENGGASWQPFSPGLPRVAIFGMEFQAMHRVLRIATHGRGIYEYPFANQRAPFDFDGDNKTDIGIFRPAGSASEWWINRSGNGQTFALQFGASTDKIAPADYTGDGKTDIAFFRPASGEWFILRSEDFSFFALPFGTNGDVPVPADYDADGKADFAVFRPSNSNWFISQSSGAPTRIFQFGITGDQPVVADYDGDGKADVGIFRQAAGGAEWWISRSTAGPLAIQFGANTDKAVQGDYTGDGKSDVAVWRPASGEWFIVRSEDFSFYGFPFGANGDVPASGDYDGDGKFDPTVFRPSSATWFIARTTAGTQIVQFGANGDRPIPNAFVP
ncbi:MAG: VCBS repeat-containing protein [Pyrinomonadaceae bacterium]